MMTPVQDPALIAQLEGNPMQPVKDPALLAQLEGGAANPSVWDSLKNNPFLTGKNPADTLNASRGTAPNIASGLWEIPPYMVAGELAEGGRLAAEGLPYVGRAAQAIGGEGWGGLGRRVLGNAAYGAAMNPGDITQGGTVGAILGGLGHGAGKAIDALMPSNFLRGSLTDDQLQKNAQIAGDTNTGLGDVVQSPFLKRLYENILSKNPFSGADAKMESTANAVIDKGNNIVNGYLGNTAPQDVESKIGQALINAQKAQVQTKNALYKNTEDLADQAGLKLDLPNFAEKAGQYTGAINDQNFLKFEPEAKQLLNRLVNYKNPVITSYPGNAGNIGQDALLYQQLKYPSLGESNILAGKLNSLSKQYGASPNAEDRYMSSVFGGLGKTLKDDIKDSINNSGNEELKDSFSKAEENYQKNFSPFLDKDVYKFTHGGKSADDIVSTFIKTGNSTDKGEQLGKLMNKLDPESQDLVKYAYLSRAMRGGEDERYVDPNALKNLWSDRSLGIKQKAALFSSAAERAALDDHAKLVGMNSESLGRMFNPKTGQRGLDAGMLLGHSLGGAIGGVSGEHQAGIPGAIAGTLAGMAVPGLASRYLTNKITSPAYRDLLIQKMLANNAGGTAGKINTSLIPLAMSAMNQGGQQ